MIVMIYFVQRKAWHYYKKTNKKQIKTAKYFQIENILLFRKKIEMLFLDNLDYYPRERSIQGTL